MTLEIQKKLVGIQEKSHETYESIMMGKLNINEIYSKAVRRNSMKFFEDEEFELKD